MMHHLLHAPIARVRHGGRTANIEDSLLTSPGRRNGREGRPGERPHTRCIRHAGDCRHDRFFNVKGHGAPSSPAEVPVATTVPANIRAKSSA